MPDADSMTLTSGMTLSGVQLTDVEVAMCLEEEGRFVEKKGKGE